MVSRPATRAAGGWLAIALIAAVAGAQERPRQVRVTAALANVRSRPSPAGRLLFQLRKGQTARLIETTGDWHHIEAAGGRRGYVYGALVQVVEPPRAAPPPPPPPPPAPVTIDHKEIGCIVAEQFPKLDACFAPEDNVGRAQIHFRAQDTDPWYSVELRKDGPCFTAYLPKPLRSTKQVQYYVDVVDRGFVEKQQPEDAPEGAYRARVVRKEKDCGGLARLAYAVGKVARPIVVGVARSSAGVVLDAAAMKLLEGQLLLAGFRPEGVIMAATGSAPGSAASAGGGGGAGTAGGGGAAGGGIGVGTIAIVGGAVAAVGLGAAAAGGGGDDSSGGGGGGQANLTGRWQGPFTYNTTLQSPGGTSTINCNFPNMTVDLTHSGSSLSGSMAPGSGSCNVAGVGDIIGGGGARPITGTAANGRITIVWNPGGGGCPPATLNGTYGANSVTTTMDVTCTLGPSQAHLTGTFNASKR